MITTQPLKGEGTLGTPNTSPPNCILMPPAQQEETSLEYREDGVRVSRNMVRNVEGLFGRENAFTTGAQKTQRNSNPSFSPIRHRDK
jgi:hypothetical protein